MSIDFAALAARLLSQSRSLLAEWYPAGRLHGHEFKVGDVHGSEGESLSVNVNTGRWADFAANISGGDLVSLYAAREGISQGEAARKLDGVEPRPSARNAAPERETWTPILPAPEGAPTPTDDYYRRGPNRDWVKLRFVARWAYTDAAGALLGYAVRFEWFDVDGVIHKDIVPQVFAQSDKGKRQWRWLSMPEPRPLYNLKGLAERPEAAVIVVEGEKKVEALRSLAPQHVAVAWPGGANAWRKADWTPLKGRRVLIWPDADDAGGRAGWDIGHHLLKLCPVVKLIIIESGAAPEAWDAADALAGGWTWDRVIAWAGPRIKLLNDGGTDEPNHQISEAQTHQTAAPTGRIAAHSPASQGDGGRELNHRPTDGSSGAPQRAERSGSGDQAAVGGASEAGSSGGLRSPLHVGDGVRAAGGFSGRVQRWEAFGVERSSNGNAIANVSNAIAVLTRDPDLRGLVWWDEFLERAMTSLGGAPRQWADADDVRLTVYLQTVIGITRIGENHVRSAVLASAMSDTRNCVRDWIDSLTWDQQPRISTFMRDVFHCEDSEYSRAVSRNFWISIAARTYRPGCKVDNMIVLEGAQGALKSTALSLIGGEWFAEQHESATNSKAFAEILQGKLLTEISEMDAFSRVEVTRVKQVVSCQSDRYRVPHARYATDHPRRGVMCGSTNKDDWNRDETGARRFWPIACQGLADLDYIRTHREQLFAEAGAVFKAGEVWHVVPDAEARREQRKRYDADPWTEAVSGWLVGRASTTVQELAQECVKLELKDLDRSRQMRLAGVLRSLGWTNGGNKWRGGKVQKVWVAPSDLYGEPEGVEVAMSKVAMLNDIPFQ